SVVVSSPLVVVPPALVVVPSTGATGKVSMVPGVVVSLGGIAPTVVAGPEGVDVSPLDGFCVAGGSTGVDGAEAGAAGGAGAGAGAGVGSGADGGSTG